MPRPTLRGNAIGRRSHSHGESQCLDWVILGKTPSECIFSELPQIADTNSSDGGFIGDQAGQASGSAQPPDTRKLGTVSMRSAPFRRRYVL